MGRDAMKNPIEIAHKVSSEIIDIGEMSIQIDLVNKKKPKQI